MRLANRVRFCTRMLSTVFLTVGICLTPLANAQDRPPHLSLEQAATATELPLPAWGPYSAQHLAPCLLTNRLQGQLFAFPIVVGQRSDAFVFKPKQIKPERVKIERRGMGLSPVQAFNDDKIDLADAPSNRFAKIVDADADGYYTKTVMQFRPANVAQKVVPAAGGTIQKWASGKADIEYFPINDGQSGDGLVIRVTVTNGAETAQTYFVDVLAGIDTPNPVFLSKDLSIAAQDDAITLKHTRRESVFALTAQPAAYPLRFYRVSDAYFEKNKTLPELENGKIALPAGRLEQLKTPKQKSDKKDEPDTSKNAIGETQWALARIDDITLAPKQQVTFTFCVALAAETDTAVNLSNNLLGLVEDVTINNKSRVGAATLAQKLHAKARYESGNAALDHLMAQSLINVPFVALRRVGVDSRDVFASSGMMGNEMVAPAQYEPLSGAMLALGWSAYRPDWSAAQLNAHFLTRLNPNEPVPVPQAIPPLNIFVLWELYQQTHDRPLLTQFYAHAKRRYEELLTAGRGKEKETEWLFAYPATMKKLAEVEGKRKPCDPVLPLYSPDYSAYVIRAAKIMKLMAEATRQKPEEMQRFDSDANNAARAMNDSLWNAELGGYIGKSADGKGADIGGTMGSLLPLIASEQKPEQETVLLKRLKDSAQFWSGYGIRSKAKNAPNYKPEQPNGGAVGFAVNYLLWKSLLDRGETQLAQQIADGLIAKYTATPGEWLHGESGIGVGDSDTTGDTMVLIALNRTYQKAGTVTAGWDTNLLATDFDAVSDSVRLVYRPLTKDNKGVILCVMGKPDTAYTLAGGTIPELKTDKNGILTVPVGADPTTQQLVIKPAPH